MTPAKYAATQMAAERFPCIWIYGVAGDFYLTDNDGHLLAGRSYKTKADAERARSKALDAASKRHWKIAA